MNNYALIDDIKKHLQIELIRIRNESAAMDGRGDDDQRHGRQIGILISISIINAVAELNEKELKNQETNNEN